MDAEAEAWKDYAEACCMHDAARAKALCQELSCLIPTQREEVADRAVQTRGSVIG